MNKYHLIYLAALMISPLPGCSCEDAYDSEWNLEDQWPIEDAGGVDGYDDDAALLDIGDEPDADEPIEPWEPEEVEPEIPYDHALTDRTSLAVDPDGTLWLGYHSCNDRACSEPMLRVTHKAVGSDWVGEDIRVHEGIFGVSVINPDEPIIAYPDSFDPTYRVAMRSSDGVWKTHDFPVPRSADLAYDGFDDAENGESYFISFAPNGAPHVSLFEYNTTDANPQWEERRPLEIENSQAAMERGLRADGDGSVYLVNQSGISGIYGVYRYDKELDRWPQSAELQSYTDLFVHSLVNTRNFGLCMSGAYGDFNNPGAQNLMVTCGSMVDLTMDVKIFGDELLSAEHPSSIIEGNDGTLYVAYNPPGNRELRVASRPPNSQTWMIETVYDGPSYGISTAIDLSGDLVISFYTCDEANLCSLKVLWEAPD